MTSSTNKIDSENPSSKTKEESSKMTSDDVRTYIFGFCSALCGALISYYVINIARLYPILREQATSHYKEKKGSFEGNIDIAMFWPCIVSFFCLTLARPIVKKMFTPIIKPFCKDQQDEAMWQERQKKAVTYLFQVLYNTSFSIWGIYILKDTDIFPSQFGGTSGKCEDYFIYRETVQKDAEFTTLFPEKVPGITVFSMACMGFAIAQIYNQFFVEAKSNDFAEMFLHHIATITLFGGMIILNQERFGCVISFVHLFADIALSLTSCSRTPLLRFSLFFVLSLLWESGATREITLSHGFGRAPFLCRCLRI